MFKIIIGNVAKSVQCCKQNPADTFERVMGAAGASMVACTMYGMGQVMFYGFPRREQNIPQGESGVSQPTNAPTCSK